MTSWRSGEGRLRLSQDPVLGHRTPVADKASSDPTQEIDQSCGLIVTDGGKPISALAALVQGPYASRLASSDISTRRRQALDNWGTSSRRGRTMPLLDSTKSGAWVGDAPLPHQPDYPSPQAQNLLPETACQFESGRGHQIFPGTWPMASGPAKRRRDRQQAPSKHREREADGGAVMRYPGWIPPAVLHAYVPARRRHKWLCRHRLVCGSSGLFT